jgi:predicted metallopeptidase
VSPVPDMGVVRSIERLRSRGVLRADVWAMAASAWAWVRADEPGRRRVRRWGSVAAGVAALAAAVAAIVAAMPQRKPDVARARLDRVFRYTLLAEEFNRLPVEERLEMIAALLAAFAAGIAGAAREQLQENVSRLLIDTWDMHAARYVQVAPEEREAFVDGAAVELHRLMDTLGGSTRAMTDEERLADMRRQAERDMRTMTRPENRPSPNQAARLFRLVSQDLGGHASPQQRLRGQQLWRDMTRRLRGQDLVDGPG